MILAIILGAILFFERCAVCGHTYDKIDGMSFQGTRQDALKLFLIPLYWIYYFVLNDRFKKVWNKLPDDDDQQDEILS